MSINSFFQRLLDISSLHRTCLVFQRYFLSLLVGLIVAGPIQAIDLTSPEAQNQLDSSLARQGIIYKVIHEGVNAQRLLINSSNPNIQELRTALYSAPIEQHMLGPQTIITLSGYIPPDKNVQLILESNPSTGYRWEFSESADNSLSQNGEYTYEDSGLLGGPAKQAIRLKATRESYVEASFVYKRPWEEDRSVQAIPASTSDQTTVQLSIQFDEIPDVIDLSNPRAVTKIAPSLKAQANGELNAISQTVSTTLPPSFDWRTVAGAGLTPVRNQGSCGSCWAFSTVGALESALMVKMSSSSDFSEQFLVSCNNNNWSCNGGWFAHDYHKTTLGKLQTTAGAVLETDMLYTATNGACKAIDNHSNRITNWNYVAGYPVPSVDQIKTAIYTYGPVSAAVCVGNGWYTYQTGVFNTNESSACGSGAVNHGIVLVGWDDNTESWILRNSWGSSWGEQGYMRIKWGISNVGYAASYVEVPTNASTYALTLTKAGEGTGTVTSAPSGINCGSTCTYDFDSNTTVTLSATPDSGSSFAGWSGACSGTGTCSVTMDATKSVTATFKAIPKYTLAITKSGSGAVTSNPAGIDCGSDCSELYLSGAPVTLSATPASGYYFSGWSGACTGTAACTVTMTAARSATATFKAIPKYTLTIYRSGSGTVASSPAGITCGSDCSEPYLSGTVVALSATPASGYYFSGWSGACAGTGDCTVSMTAARSVTATFKANPVLTVSRSGSGTVTSNPAGINCGSDCSEPYASGTVVALNATPASGYYFGGWSGACTGTGACTVTMTAARSVTATFKAIPKYTLTVRRSGSGTVVSDVAGITCGSDCSEPYLSGKVVTITATPASGYMFGGWSGACAGTGECVVTMSAAKSVTATFKAIPKYTLTIYRSGSGTVASSPAGITCGSDCSEPYLSGTVVALSATPASGYYFSGWSGACTGTGDCKVSMTAAKSVTATFTK